MVVYTGALDGDCIRRKTADERYSLDIVQQPVRARMCGFGDKVSGGSWNSTVSKVAIGDLECVKMAIADTLRRAGQTAYHATALYQTCGQGCKYF